MERKTVIIVTNTESKDDSYDYYRSLSQTISIQGIVKANAPLSTYDSLPQC